MNEDTREILLILMEECAEVTQAISKAFRFGPDQIKPTKDFTNIYMVEQEIGDLLAMVDLLVSKNIGVTTQGLNTAKAAKLEKLKQWSNIDVDKLLGK
jgi:NTP pyrophosphatase (non-canonical NTP hydrolase)